MGDLGSIAQGLLGGTMAGWQMGRQEQQDQMTQAKLAHSISRQDSADAMRRANLVFAGLKAVNEDPNNAPRVAHALTAAGVQLPADWLTDAQGAQQAWGLYSKGMSGTLLTAEELANPRFQQYLGSKPEFAKSFHEAQRGARRKGAIGRHQAGVNTDAIASELAGEGMHGPDIEAALGAPYTQSRARASHFGQEQGKEDLFRSPVPGTGFEGSAPDAPVRPRPGAFGGDLSIDGRMPTLPSEPPKTYGDLRRERTLQDARPTLMGTEMNRALGVLFGRETHSGNATQQQLGAAELYLREQAEKLAKLRANAQPGSIIYGLNGEAYRVTPDNRVVPINTPEGDQINRPEAKDKTTQMMEGMGYVKTPEGTWVSRTSPEGQAVPRKAPARPTQKTPAPPKAPPATGGESLSMKDARYKQLRTRGMSDEQIQKRFGVKLVP